MIDLLVKRARGELKTGAKFMRDFVVNHPKYEHDSIVPKEVCYELVREVQQLGNGEKWDESLLGPKPSFMKDS